MNELERALGYSFLDKSLLEAALTHPSYGSDHRARDYQRLEFLGDAVLQLAVSRRLYRERADLEEGRLTFARAQIVREEALAEAARSFHLGAYARLSPGEEKNGGRDKPSILCDMMEAVIAAVYLDGGQAQANALIDRALHGAFERSEHDDGLDDKSKLQIFLQKDGLAPEYELLSREGAPHEPTFRVRVLVGGKPLSEGEGHSKREAQQAAARRALSRLTEDGE